jgi:hypothetical protein
MSKSLSKRYEGHEAEIFRDIRLYGKVGAMFRWGARDFVAWEKMLAGLGWPQVGKNELSMVPEQGLVSLEISRPLNFDCGALKVMSDRKSLAEELVDAFTEKVTRIQNENDELRSRLAMLEKQLEYFKTNSDEYLADKMIKAFEVIR